MHEEKKQSIGQAGPSPAGTRDGKSETDPIELIELGQSVDHLLEQFPVFADAVRRAVEPLGGEFLFDLPNSEKPNGKGRVAAVRMRYAGSEELRTVFVFLSDDAMDAHAEPSDTQKEHLRQFAESFVGVLERIASH